MDIFIDLINWILTGISETIEWILSVFPKSPVKEWSNEMPENVVLGHIVWFIPFPTMLIHLTVLLSAIGIYYLYRIIGRWLKVVRS